MNNYGFDKEAYAAFMEAATEHYDFTTCQRPDGSYYGTGGTCRKGTQATKPDEKPKSKKCCGGKSGVCLLYTSPSPRD